MTSYLLKKLALLLASLWVVVTATFILMKTLPGDPFAEEQGMPEEVSRALRSYYHLDDPWPTQYVNYMISIAHWDLGPSFKYKARDVNEIISSSFAVSASLGLQALLVAVAGGIFLGTAAAIRSGKWPDTTAMAIAMLSVSIPSFLLAAFLQYLFAIKIPLFPVARWGTFAHTILPTLALAATPMASIARLTRSSLTEVMRHDYIRTAYAKGLSTFEVVRTHALRNACLPVITYLGPLTANILTGSFVVERIFGIPGLGQWFVASVLNRDYSVIMGLTVFYSAILLMAILVVDVVYALIDPRLKVALRSEAS